MPPLAPPLGTGLPPPEKPVLFPAKEDVYDGEMHIDDDAVGEAVTYGQVNDILNDFRGS